MNQALEEVYSRFVTAHEGARLEKTSAYQMVARHMRRRGHKGWTDKKGQESLETPHATGHEPSELNPEEHEETLSDVELSNILIKQLQQVNFGADQDEGQRTKEAFGNGL